MKNKIIVIFLLGLFCVPAGALLSEIGEYPLEPDNAGRPYGLGGAFVGLGDDVNTVLYNPGGLAWAKGISLTLRDSGNITAVQAYPTGFSSSVCLGVVTRKISNIPMSGGWSGHASGDTILLGFGGKLSTIFPNYNDAAMERIGIGFTVKRLISETLRRTHSTLLPLDDRTGTGWDLDVGLLWKAGKWWSAGLVGENILPDGSLGGGRLLWDNGQSEGFPSSLKLGVAGRLINDDFDSPIFMDGRQLILAAEYDYNNGRSNLLKAGLEFSLEQTYYLRAGLHQQTVGSAVVSNLNYGLGIRQDRWSLDLSTYREPLTDQLTSFVSIIYFPRGWELVKQLDLAAPEVILDQAIEEISLQNNIVTYDENFKITGRVKPGVDLFINDLQAAVDQENNFEVVVPLRLQKNLVIVEARYQGEKKLWKYKVLRKAQVEVAETQALEKQLEAAKTETQKTELKQQVEQVKRVEEKVEELVTVGVIEVTPEASFELQAGVSRGELCSWLVKAADVRLPEVTRDVFPDVPRDHPLAPYIKIIAELGLLKPYPDGTFRPNAAVTKAEGDEIFRYFGVEQR